MSDLLIRDFTVPSKCMECEWRDAEACGECELMLGNPFTTLEEQFAHCPFQVIAKHHVFDTIPSHGRCIDADALIKSDRMVGKLMMFGGEYVYTQAEIDRAPTILPAKEGE